MFNSINQDILIYLVQILIKDSLIYMTGNFTPYWYCNHCFAELNGWDVQKKDFKHNIDCPVLVAQYVLNELKYIKEKQK